MSGHQNNHERTSASIVREELDRAIDSIAPNVPVQKKQEAVSRLEAVFEKYSSPYPDAKFLGEIEGLCPGAAQKILDETERDLNHRRQMDVATIGLRSSELDLVKSIASGEVKSNSQGRWIGFAAYVMCLTFSGVMAYFGQEILAYSAFGTAALGVIGQLIRGHSTSSVTVTAEKLPAETSKRSTS